MHGGATTGAGATRATGSFFNDVGPFSAALAQSLCRVASDRIYFVNCDAVVVAGCGSGDVPTLDVVLDELDRPLIRIAIAGAASATDCVHITLHKSYRLLGVHGLAINADGCSAAGLAAKQTERRMVDAVHAYADRDRFGSFRPYFEARGGARRDRRAGDRLRQSP